MEGRRDPSPCPWSSWLSSDSLSVVTKWPVVFLGVVVVGLFSSRRRSFFAASPSLFLVRFRTRCARWVPERREIDWFEGRSGVDRDVDRLNNLCNLPSDDWLRPARPQNASICLFPLLWSIRSAALCNTYSILQSTLNVEAKPETSSYVYAIIHVSVLSCSSTNTQCSRNKCKRGRRFKFMVDFRRNPCQWLTIFSSETRRRFQIVQINTPLQTTGTSRGRETSSASNYECRSTVARYSTFSRYCK